MLHLACQMILAFGIYQSTKQPDEIHPYGWSNFRYITSLISGVGIFFLGAGMSVYHGVSGLVSMQAFDSHNLYWVCIRRLSLENKDLFSL